MKKICKNCKTETNNLYGLFVPFLCEKCYNKLRDEQIKEREVCSLCKKPYIDCYC